MSAFASQGAPRRAAHKLRGLLLHPRCGVRLRWCTLRGRLRSQVSAAYAPRRG